MPEERRVGRKEAVEDRNEVTVPKYLSQLQDIYFVSSAHLALIGTEQQ